MTAEEFVNNKGKTQFGTFGDSYPKSLVEKYLIEFAQYHVKEALLEASENAEVQKVNWRYEDTDKKIVIYDNQNDANTITVYKSSILNSYPDDRIK